MLARFYPLTDVPLLARRASLGDFVQERNPLFESARRLSSPPALAADITETDNELHISLDMPGHDPAAVQVRVEGSTLVVESERHAELTEGTFWRERSYGRFARTFDLPPWVDGARVEARFRHGVLNVTLPRRDDAKPRSVQVKVES